MILQSCMQIYIDFFIWYHYINKRLNLYRKLKQLLTNYNRKLESNSRQERKNIRYNWNHFNPNLSNDAQQTSKFPYNLIRGEKNCCKVGLILFTRQAFSWSPLHFEITSTTRNSKSRYGYSDKYNIMFWKKLLLMIKCEVH